MEGERGPAAGERGDARAAAPRYFATAGDKGAGVWGEGFGATFCVRWGSSGPNMLGLRWGFMGGARFKLPGFSEACPSDPSMLLVFLDFFLEAGGGEGALVFSSCTGARDLVLRCFLSFSGRGGGKDDSRRVLGAGVTVGAFAGVDFVRAFFTCFARAFSSSSDDRYEPESLRAQPGAAVAFSALAP